MDDAASRGRPGRARSPLDRIFVDGAWREGRARRRPGTVRSRVTVRSVMDPP